MHATRQATRMGQTVIGLSAIVVVGYMWLGKVWDRKRVQSSNLQFHSPTREVARKGQSGSRRMQDISSMGG